MSFFGTSEQFTRSLPANRSKIRVNQILLAIILIMDDLSGIAFIAKCEPTHLHFTMGRLTSAF